jgi:hypothetical protein
MCAANRKYYRENFGPNVFAAARQAQTDRNIIPISPRPHTTRNLVRRIRRRTHPTTPSRRAPGCRTTPSRQTTDLSSHATNERPLLVPKSAVSPRSHLLRFVAHLPTQIRPGGRDCGNGGGRRRTNRRRGPLGLEHVRVHSSVSPRCEPSKGRTQVWSKLRRPLQPPPSSCCVRRHRPDFDMLTSQGAEVRQAEATRERSGAEF